MARTFSKVCRDRLKFFEDADGPDRAEGERECLDCISEKSTAGILSSLLSLKFQVSGYGTVKVLNGDESGWTDLKLGWQLEELGFRCAFQRLESGKFSRIPLEKLALFLCASVAFGESARARRLLRQTIVGCQNGLGISQHSKPPDRAWKNADFARFVLQMLGESFGMNMQKVQFPGDYPLGEFERIFKAWKSKSAMTKALKWMCDYHVTGTKSTNAHPKGEFATMPYDVFPVEVIVTRYLWERQFETRLNVKHELIQENPLAVLPQRMKPVDDTFLADFEARIRKRLQRDLPEFTYRSRKSIATL